MITTRRSRAARLAVPLTVLLVVAGCGGDDDDDATSTPATEVAADTTNADGTTVTATEAPAGTTVAPTPETSGAAPTTAAAPGTTTAVDGSPYTSTEGDYSVVFPTQPAEQTQSQALPDGQTVDLVFAGVEVDDGFLATARGQYPDGYVLDVPVALQGAQDQAIANVSGTLISSQDITLQGRPGREFSATITNGSETGTLLQRVYLDGLVIYQQIFTGAGDATFADPELATFFESFAFATG